MNLDKEIALLLDIPLLKDPVELGKAMKEKETALFETEDGLIGIIKNGKPINFSPSSSIEQAIELLEGLSWTLDRKPCPGFDPFGCRINNGPWSYGLTPSEAICKAWISYKNKL